MQSTLVLPYVRKASHIHFDQIEPGSVVSTMSGVSPSSIAFASFYNPMMQVPTAELVLVQTYVPGEDGNMLIVGVFASNNSGLTRVETVRILMTESQSFPGGTDITFDFCDGAVSTAVFTNEGSFLAIEGIVSTVSGDTPQPS